MVPPHFVDLDALPLTPNGKIDQGALPTLFSVGGGTAENYVVPRTETEVRLARMWEQILGIE